MSDPKRGKTSAASTPGSFAPHSRSESEAALDWVPGTPHPTGGYDNVRLSDSGHTRYTLNGELHRLDGPALEWANGDAEWWADGQPHRLGAPAIEFAAARIWLVRGKRHRLDGPAIERRDGTKKWFIDDVELTEAEFEAQRTSQA